MKYCERCGEQLEDDAVFCPKCGQRCDGLDGQNNQNFNPNNFGPNYNNPYQKGQYTNDPDSNKSIRGTGLGVIFALFLGPIGLILILILGDKKAKKGCLITFGISIVAEILLIMLIVMFGAMNGMSMLL